MLQSLLSADIPTCERIFSKFVLETLSYFNAGRKTKEVERVFQAFLLGMLIGLKNTHEVYSEKESGYGRFDVSVVPKDKSKQAIIMELKSIDTFNNETKEDTLNAALAQIEERQYETLLRQQGCQNIMKLAVTFDGKRVWVKRGA
ncbi:MAG: PD-(D/E)XK nuclease domain-containing protein [Bacteroidales bacterium]